MSSISLDALSPVDGRYRAATEPLRGVLSEGGLIRERIRVEALWVTHLAAAAPRFAGSTLPAAVRTRVLRRFAAEAGANALSQRHVAALDALVTGWRGQGPVSLPGGVLVCRRERHLSRVDPVRS